VADRAHGERGEDRREEIDSLRLVERFQRGEREVIQDLYARYFDRVYSHVRVLLVRSADLEDVVQQVFVAMLEGLARYEPQAEASFRSWLFGIARHKALMHLRVEGRAELLAPSEIGQLVDSHGHDRNALGGWLSDPELTVAILGLSAFRREVLFWRYAADLSMAEIAAAMGSSEAAARQAHARAMRTLRHRLEVLDDDQGKLRKPLAARQLAWGVRRAMAHSFSPARP
jgi:RNA polymerase sigma-70 factor (ECF subfamily)